MQPHHLEQELGYKPGNLTRDWNRQNTGGINKVTRSTNVERKNTDRLSLIADQVTIMELQAIPKSPPLPSEKLVAQVLMPKKQILCFDIRDRQRSTLDLVEDAINICLSETGKYPYCVVLEPLRYLSMLTVINLTGGCYAVKNTNVRIPYAYAKEIASYDVMAVCEVQ
jgi:hypothetical protein